MPRLIDADELMKKARRMYGESEVFSIDPVGLRAVLLDDIYRAPTIDAEPVRHGRWVAVPSFDVMTGKAYKCSECNKMRYGSFMPNYCQNCGAKMDGGKDNDCE